MQWVGEPRRRVLTNATLIDCVDPRPTAGVSVTIESGRIV